MISSENKGLFRDADGSSSRSCLFYVHMEKSMVYKLFDNLDIWFPGPEDCEGRFDFPKIKAQKLPDVNTWIPFNSARQAKLDKRTGIHMYIHDYRMSGLWRYPHRYLSMLREAGCVLSPDMSMYTDEPIAMQIMGAYKRQWLGSWWQRQGLTVVPTAGWSSESSIQWCFDGMPIGGAVAVSSIGTQKHAWSKRLFRYGYDAMMERCKPEEVLFFGIVPDGLRGNIVKGETFVESIRERCNVDEQNDERIECGERRKKSGRA